MIKNCDVVVIGAGHAGAEAALAAARLQCKTVVLTVRLAHVARMPCNPSIGGPAKAQLVKEVDALGGEMGRVIDQTHIHIRMLNTGKGPAVHALRAQADRLAYSTTMRKVIEAQPNLELIQDTATKILEKNGRVIGVEGATGNIYSAQAVIVTTGTFLKGRLFVGETSMPGGRSGEPATTDLSESLKNLGLELGRLKTGTTPRIHKDSINYKAMTEQKPSPTPLVFSEISPLCLPPRQISCFLTKTTLKTKEIILNNLHRSPMYRGEIEGIGPRYCPSIEDKIVRFPQRDVHQVFVEPEGFTTPEVYLQGVSTSLPIEVQQDLVRSITGLENAQILRPGYAVEYDYVLPTQLDHTLQVRGIPGLFLAGINAARSIKGENLIELRRDQAYIGVLIDDLVTRGTSEPYRMHTSRAEYRLILRQDNADRRLTPLGRQIGLVCDKRWKIFQDKQNQISQELIRLQERKLSITEATTLSREIEQKINPGTTLAELLKRPHIDLNRLRALDHLPPLSDRVRLPVEVEIKYAGYIKRQQEDIEKFTRLESLEIPPGLHYQDLNALSAESREKLAKQRPRTVGQASRIPGVTPSDIAALLVIIHRYTKTKKLTRS